MHLILGEHHKKLLEDASRLSESFGLEYWRGVYDARRFPEEYWSKLSALRFPGIILDSRYGGLGLGLVELVLITERLAAGGAGLGLYAMLSNNLAGLVIQQYGSESARALLPRVVRGELLIGLAFTEEEAGSDAFAIKTTATKGDEGYVLQGEKMFVNNVGRATHYLVMARTSQPTEGRRSHGLTLFLVDSNSSGISYAYLSKMGLDYLTTGRMTLDNVYVGREMVVGSVDEGWKAIVNALNADRIAYAALAVGAGRLALNIAVDYAKRRRVFGREIGGYQAIQFPLAASYAELEAAWLLTLNAAVKFDKGESSDVDACLCKYLATEAAFRAVERSMQTLGGHGYLRDYHVERLFRDVLLLKSGPITQELALAYVAQRGLGLPRSF